MTPEELAKIFLSHTPGAKYLERGALEDSISKYVISSYANAMATVSTSKALGRTVDDSYSRTMKQLEPYLGNSSRVASAVLAITGQAENTAPDPSQMTMEQYSEWRKATQRRGKGMFD